MFVHSLVDGHWVIFYLWLLWIVLPQTVIMSFSLSIHLNYLGYIPRSGIVGPHSNYNAFTALILSALKNWKWGILKLNINVPHDPAIPFLGISHEKWKYIITERFAWVFIAALFILVLILETTRSIHSWISKNVVYPAMKYHCLSIKEWITHHITTSMNLRNIMCVRGQT